MKELRALDEARRRYLHHQQVLKEDHVAQLDKDIQKKVRTMTHRAMFLISRYLLSPSHTHYCHHHTLTTVTITHSLLSPSHTHYCHHHTLTTVTITHSLLSPSHTHYYHNYTLTVSPSHSQIVQRDIETQAAIEDIELQTLELQAQRALLEQELRQRNDEATYRLRTDHSARQLTQDVERDLLRMNMEEDVEREGVRVRDAQVQLALAQADKEDEELNDEAVLQKDFGGLQDGLGREEVRKELLL